MDIEKVVRKLFDCGNDEEFFEKTVVPSLIGLYETSGNATRNAFKTAIDAGGMKCHVSFSEKSVLCLIRNNYVKQLCKTVEMKNFALTEEKRKLMFFDSIIMCIASEATYAQPLIKREKERRQAARLKKKFSEVSDMKRRAM